MSEDNLKTPRKRRVANSAVEGNPGNNNERTLKVEVSKYKALDNILGNSEKTWRVIFIIVLLGIALFVALTFIALCLKRYYSYSDITTNGLGATTFKSEKSEVSYWLYNTSQLWANSGITVNAGDLISVRSSGKFITAIHHVYDNVTKNESFKDDWVGSEGERDNNDVTSSSYLRRKFRMFPNLPTGALVMQVVENEPFDYDRDPRANKENFYFIGKGREDIYIKNPGTLYFSLNDIVLNHETIVEMVFKCLERDLKKDFLELRSMYGFSNSFENTIDSARIKFSDDLKYYHHHPSELFGLYDMVYGKLIKGMNRGDRKLGDIKIGVSYIKLNEIKEKLGASYYLGTTSVKNGLIALDMRNNIFCIVGKNIEDRLKDCHLKESLRFLPLTSTIKSDCFELIKDKLKVLLQDNDFDKKLDTLDYDFLKKEIKYNYKDISLCLLMKLLRIDYKTAYVVTEKSICADKYQKYYKTTVPNNLDISDVKKNQNEIIQIDTIVKMCELEYYYMKNYKTAWFDDNLGSFLIVIEKNNSK